MEDKKIPPLSQRFVWLVISFLPFIIFAIMVAGFVYHWALGLALTYLFPPVLARLVFTVLGKPVGIFSTKSKGFFSWFLSYQIQAVYMRLPFIEEVLRLIPRLYSVWLRIWGSKIGKAVTWSPGVIIIDRGLVEVGDYSLLGFGAVMSSHMFLSRPNGEFELEVAIPTTGKRVILGGQSRMAPGSYVADYEMLPATFDLAPYYEFKGGRRRSMRAKDAAAGGET